MIWIFKGSVICILIAFYVKKDMVINVLAEEDIEKLVMMTQSISYQKFATQRIYKCMVACLLIVIAILFDYDLAMISGSSLLVFVVYKQPYWRMKLKLKEYRKKLSEQFPVWLRQLQILLQHNTVMVALELSIPHSPLLIRGHLNELVGKLRENPRKLSVYNEFLADYQCVEIVRAMKLLYRYNTVGQQDAMHQLNRMISTTGRWLKESRNEKMKSSDSLSQWWAMAPLVAVTGVFIVMMMQTIVLLLERR